jgi:hypothetical protein
MAAPKTPNVTKAAATRRRMGDLTASNRLVDAGYLVLTPDELRRIPIEASRDLQDVLLRLDIRVPLALLEERQSS